MRNINNGLNGLNGFLLLGKFNNGLNGLNGFVGCVKIRLIRLIRC